MTEQKNEKLMNFNLPVSEIFLLSPVNQFELYIFQYRFQQKKFCFD
jgi:hypothetical protein